MRRIIFTLLVISLLVSLAGAHGIEKGPIIKTTQNYKIEFSTEPVFPVTGKDTHLDFIVKDKDGNLLPGLDIRIELHNQEKTITLDLNEEDKGHYTTVYNFNEPGNYEIHPVIDSKELEIEFDLAVDTFGSSGLLRSGIIVILLLIFIGLMYKDCRGRKHG